MMIIILDNIDVVYLFLWTFS